MFYRFFPSSDTWITNIYKNLLPQTGSNYGKDPVLSVFARKDEQFSGSIELGRALLDFPISELSGKIFLEQTIPSSSVSYYLKMFNMISSDRQPSSFNMFAFPLSRSWDEGNGAYLDYLDVGYANWMSASSVQSWTNTGSDYISTMSASQHFDFRK